MPRSKPHASLVFVLLAMTACSDGVDWSRAERENARHIAESLAATSAAAEIANAAGSETELLAGRDALLQHLRAAHIHAARVDDTVLDKLHPQLQPKFRLDYQRSLAAMIRAYENGDVDAAQDAAAKIGDFTEWYRRENHTFRWWDEALR